MLVLTASCTTHQTIRPPAPGEAHTALKGEVRVTHVDGRGYVLRDARLQSDSVIGTNAAGARIAVATNEVGTIDERRISAARTTALVGGAALAVGTVILIAGAIAFASLY